ncbi:MAG: saccharopine dehydrogenase C-terminal domain-containing protein [Longimonas sp.]|uniref:saccharopine dehydrogenase family protein n=1 Tax=Longimonas sp. TaxID=2039626 RepID=UPI00397680F7
MTITVVGAGAIGAAVVRELCRHDDVDQVQVCDTRSRALQTLHDSVEHNGALRSFQVDARDLGVLSQIVRESNCVISGAPSELNPELAELCLDLGVNFCDLGGNEDIVKQELALNDRAREKAVWIVPNCGLAPGLVNVLTMRGLEQFDRPTAASIRVGDVPLNPEPPFNFRISWSAERIIDDYTRPAQHIADGKLVEVDALSGDETIRFDGPFENMEAFSTQGGLSTLTDTLDGRVPSFDHKTIRWPGHAHQMRFVIGLGFGQERKIGVRTHLTYRDLLVRRMRERLSGDYEDAVLMRVMVQGEKDGAPKTLVYEMVERYNEDDNLTAMMRCTSIPIVVVAKMIAGHTISEGGARVPEAIVPKEDYCDALRTQGLNITETWYDGHVRVTDKQPADATHTA